MSDKILNTLLAAGFLPNYDKSIFTPVQSIDWLGFTWNLKDGVSFKEKDQKNIQTLSPRYFSRKLRYNCCESLTDILNLEQESKK
jgi:hypothetical protein